MAADLVAAIPDATVADVKYAGREISYIRAGLSIRKKLRAGEISKRVAQAQAKKILDQLNAATIEHSGAGVRILQRLAGANDRRRERE